jgi:hypothetical protein
VSIRCDGKVNADAVPAYLPDASCSAIANRASFALSTTIAVRSAASQARLPETHYLSEKAIVGEAAAVLMETDAKEKLQYRQATRDAFQMADVFVSGASDSDYVHGLRGLAEVW